MNELRTKARAIQLLILDVDGVMTDGGIIVTDKAEEIKGFHVQDGLGIQFLLESGFQVAVITGRNSPLVAARIEQLKIPHLYQGQINKVAAYEDLLNKLNLTPAQTAHVGDDLPDIPLFRRVGLAVAVANAVPLVKEYADWTTQASGGRGAVREICDFILDTHNKLAAIEKRFTEE
ncbi:MAG: 3-deoxy-manno-octulosonate-8-phosphatase KdsC [Gammaproteobacteria bacterium]|nr:3-deoxy-manno-octulosonate-8-phosphatase KdsC [Gammaproteobacteria bacterium]